MRPMKQTEMLAGNNQTAPTAEDSSSRAGVLLGLTAYLIWGSFPVFFKALEGVSETAAG